MGKSLLRTMSPWMCFSYNSSQQCLFFLHIKSAVHWRWPFITFALISGIWSASLKLPQTNTASLFKLCMESRKWRQGLTKMESMTCVLEGRMSVRVRKKVRESRQERKTARTIIKHSMVSVKAYKSSLKACRSVAVRGVTACLFLIKLLVRYWGWCSIKLQIHMSDISMFPF